ncbi:uncharacterized protein LTR77_011100 [Saxophila tyrrhenica]|uniref:F-box domain-containing protein n=1 Tax=Saxophila tyrrhenica TaxID=1690608 RepID=A0AAV9NXH4_9PEZI|nr:hypothetical protein LTR77_011100 [Saxophila tyrrhenica]
MALGRLYYTIALLFCCTLYCTSHYDASWPSRGWKPTSGWGSKYKRHEQEKQAKARKEAERQQKNERAGKRAVRRASHLVEEAEQDFREGEEKFYATRVAQNDEWNGDEYWREKARRRARDPRKGRSEEAEAGGQAREEHRPARKKLKIETNMDFSYDETGAPVFSSFAKGRAVEHRYGGKPTDGNAALLGPQQTPTNFLRTPSLKHLSLTTPVTPSTPASAVPRNPDGSFSLLNGLCRDDSLLLRIVGHLTLPSLNSLYAISKTFHYLFNRHHTAFILAMVRTWAFGAETIFPWRHYKALCVKDPTQIQKMRMVGKAGMTRKQYDDLRKQCDDLRDCPGLKWLAMVIWRQGVCEDMLVQLRVNGLWCPPGTLESVKKMWFLMDMPLNALRIPLIRDSKYFSNTILQNFTHFMLKVDMLLTDPVAPQAPTDHPNKRLYPEKHDLKVLCGADLRKMLLAEKQMTGLWRVIRGWSPDPEDGQREITNLDVLRLWVRHEYRHPQGTSEKKRRLPIMGIPWYEVGMAGMERTGVALAVAMPDKSKAQQGGQPRPQAQQVAVTHSSVAGSSTISIHHAHAQAHGQAQYGTPKMKPRERLFRPDELVMRECFRRGMKMHKKVVKMMAFGFSDVLGREYPVLSEEEILKGLRGNGEGLMMGVDDMDPRVVFGDGWEEGEESDADSENGGEGSTEQMMEEDDMEMVDELMSGQD